MVSSSIFRLVPPKIPQELGGLQLGTGLGESWRWIGPLERCHARGSAARGLPRRIICWNFHWEFHGTFMGISWEFPGDFMGISLEFHDISWQFPVHFMGISWEIHGKFLMGFSWFPGNFLCISQFHGNFMGIPSGNLWEILGKIMATSWEFHENFMGVSRE